MDNCGPATQKKIEAVRALKARVAKVGMAIGVPDDLARQYVEIEARERLTDSIDSLHTDLSRWQKEAGISRGVFKKVIAYLNGLLKAED